MILYVSNPRIFFSSALLMNLLQLRIRLNISFLSPLSQFNIAIIIFPIIFCILKLPRSIAIDKHFTNFREIAKDPY